MTPALPVARPLPEARRPDREGAPAGAERRGPSGFHARLRHHAYALTRDRDRRRTPR